MDKRVTMAVFKMTEILATNLKLYNEIWCISNHVPVDMDK
jgi:hypothetical protein